MKCAWDFQLCAWFSVALIRCVSLTPDAWKLTGLLEYSFCQIIWNSSFLAIWRLQKHCSSCSVFWCVLFYKNLIILHHGDNNFLFWHLHQNHTFNNNLKDEEMITSHLDCVIKRPFYDKNIVGEKKKRW